MSRRDNSPQPDWLCRWLGFGAMGLGLFVTLVLVGSFIQRRSQSFTGPKWVYGLASWFGEFNHPLLSILIVPAFVQLLAFLGFAYWVGYRASRALAFGWALATGVSIAYSIVIILCLQLEVLTVELFPRFSLIVMALLLVLTFSISRQATCTGRRMLWFGLGVHVVSLMFQSAAIVWSKYNPGMFNALGPNIFTLNPMRTLIYGYYQMGLSLGCVVMTLGILWATRERYNTQTAFLADPERWCHACGYDLTGTVASEAGACPECGAVIEPNKSVSPVSTHAVC